jgi:hypothetical protein
LWGDRRALAGDVASVGCWRVTSRISSIELDGAQAWQIAILVGLNNETWSPREWLPKEVNWMFHYSDYLREQAQSYRSMADKAEDPFIKQEFVELAETCEEVANSIDERRASG